MFEFLSVNNLLVAAAAGAIGALILERVWSALSAKTAAFRAKVALEAKRLEATTGNDLASLHGRVSTLETETIKYFSLHTRVAALEADVAKAKAKIGM